jgi:hypothetical protein
MATKRATSKKGAKKGAKKASKKATKKATKKASAKSASFTMPKIDPACLRKCVAEYRKCLASGLSPTLCRQRFARCVAGCVKF